MRKIEELIAELSRWQIKISVEYGRVILSGGDRRARETYSSMLAKKPKIEAHLIFELAKSAADLMFEIEERAAIREADGLPGDLWSAIMCNIAN